MPSKDIKTANQPSHLKDLLLLFSVPIGIAIFAATIIYIPRLLANPKYDFVYSYCSSYDCSDSYFVDSAGYAAKAIAQSPDRNYYNGLALLRYYDADTDSTRSITAEEARRYQLNTSSKSPDGYSLNREETSSGFLLWGEYDDGWYLKNGAKRKKIELSNSDSYYSDQIKFLGWINE